MKKRYETIMPKLVIMACALCVAVSCSLHRTGNTVATTSRSDTTRSYIHADTAAAALSAKAQQADTSAITHNVSGSLSIERDSTGLPVLYIWNVSAHHWQARTIASDFSGIFSGSSSGSLQSSESGIQREVEKTTTSLTKVGPELEQCIGIAVVLFVLLYTLYIIAENIWRRHRA